jgi:hypothetical protein
MMKEKMRIALRVVSVKGHRRFMLGALGCGAFLNPKEEVADCWVLESADSVNELIDIQWGSCPFI